MWCNRLISEETVRKIICSPLTDASEITTVSKVH